MPQKQLDIWAVLNGRIDNSFTSLGSALTSLGSMVNTVSQPLINLGKEGLETYATYEQNMKDAEGALSSSYDSTYELNTVMEGLDEAAQQWAASTKFTTEDVSLAISEAAHAGYDYQQILQAMPQTMLLAQAGNLDLSTSLDYVIKSTNALGMDLDDLGTFIDQWAMGANSSATTIDEFGQAMLKMGATMQFADSTEELFTMLAVLANTGTTGAAAGTLLRNSMLRLIAPTEKAQEAMADLGDVTDEEMMELEGDSEQLRQANEMLEGMGFSAYDSQGKLKPMLQIFKELNDLTQDMTEDERNGILGAIFPSRTITGAMNLLQAAAEDYDGLYEQIENSNGYAQQVSDIQMDSLTGKTAIFKSKLEELKRSIGEVLAPQVEAGESFLGQFIDKLNELDDDKLTMLVSGLEGIAIAGPAMMTLGMFIRLIGMIPTPVGIATAGVIGLATAFGMLAANKDMTIKENFGDMALDIDTLMESIEGLEPTEGESQFAALQSYVDELSTIATEYQTAATALSQGITIGEISGKTFTEGEQNTLVSYGETMGDKVIEGVNKSWERNVLALGALFDPENDGYVDEEEYPGYSRIYDLLTTHRDTLIGKATSLGTELNDAILDAFEDDGRIDEVEAEKIRQLIEAMNEVQAQVAAYENAEEYSKMLEKSQSVSLESLDQFLTELEENTEERKQIVSEPVYAMMGDARQAIDEERAEQGLPPMTDEEWHATPEYANLNEPLEQQYRQIEESTAGPAVNAIRSALRNSPGYGDLFTTLEEMYNAAPKDENGRADLTQLDLEKYFPTQESRDEALNTLSEFNLLEGPLGFFGTDTELAKRAEEWKDTAEGAALYSLLNYGGRDLQSLLMGNRLTGGQEAVNAQYAADSAANMSMWAEIGEEPPTYPTSPTLFPSAEEGEGLSATVTQVEAAEGVTLEGLSATVDSVTFASPTPQDVDMGEGTMNAQADVTGTAEAASEAHSELQGAMDAAGDITAQSDVPNAAAAGAEAHNEIQYTIDAMGNIHFSGAVSNTGDISNQIQSAVNSRTYFFNAAPRVNGLMGGYATGGRADTISFFGENGPEWAIPEEHSEHTAELINQTIQASGFDWDELYSRFAGDDESTFDSLPAFAEGGRADAPSLFGEAGPEWAIPERHDASTAMLIDQARSASGFSWSELQGVSGDTTSSSSTTLVYSPTIVANDATDVESKLREDKARLQEQMERWWRDRETREQLEVYAT